MVLARFSWLRIGASHFSCQVPELLRLKIYTRVKIRTHDQMPFTMDVWVRRQVNPCQISSEKSDNWTGFSSPSTVAVP